MDPSAFERIEQSCKALKVDLSSKEMAVFTEQQALTPEQLGAVADLFHYLEEKKHRNCSGPPLSKDEFRGSRDCVFDCFKCVKAALSRGSHIGHNAEIILRSVLAPETA